MKTIDNLIDFVQTFVKDFSLESFELIDSCIIASLDITSFNMLIKRHSSLVNLHINCGNITILNSIINEFEQSYPLSDVYYKTIIQKILDLYAHVGLTYDSSIILNKDISWRNLKASNEFKMRTENFNSTDMIFNSQIMFIDLGIKQYYPVMKIFFQPFDHTAKLYTQTLYISLEKDNFFILKEENATILNIDCIDSYMQTVQIPLLDYMYHYINNQININMSFDEFIKSSKEEQSDLLTLLKMATI